MKALHQSRKGVLFPQTYKAMCCQCGEMVQHKLGDDEAPPCRNGHAVAPTLSRAMFFPPRPTVGDGSSTTKPAQRPMTRRAIKAHNRRYYARAAKQQRAGQ